jgi:hypothetical protein
MAEFMDMEKMVFPEIILKGKHAEYVKFLCTNKSQDDDIKQSKVRSLFDNYLQCFLVCTILGLKNGIKKDVDTSSNVQDAHIKENTFFRRLYELEGIYHMVILLDNREKSPKECVELAFSTDEQQILKNVETVYSYFRGGLEFVYDKFKDMQIKENDEFIDMLWDFIEDYHELQDPPLPSI